MSARYWIQRYLNVRLPATTGAGDFPIAASLLLDTTVGPTSGINTQGGIQGAWVAPFAKECALENVQLWIQPLTASAVSWKVQLNGNDNAVAVATTSMPLPKNVFSLSGPIPAADIVLNCNITNGNATAVIVSVWWVALIRNPLV